MNKVIIITGSRKGIGLDLAKYYLNKRMIVAGCSRNDSDFTHKDYFHFTLDVADEKAVINMIKDVVKKFGTIHYLVNNAGIASMNHSFLTPYDVAQNIINTNLLGSFLFSREAGKIMSRNKFGRIINFATFAVPFKLAGESVYAASKAGIISLTETLSREYAPFGITVNAVAPPAVKTDLIKNVPAEKMDNLLQRQAIHNYGTYKDIANVIDFFLMDESAMVTGQTIYLGGI
ncbi:MAG: SDR family oxidoreductase [Bacteroidales bacterium]|nr:SDR family oxidoreductase [Bacteroidales bacterium]